MEDELPKEKETPEKNGKESKGEDDEKDTALEEVFRYFLLVIRT